MSRIFCLETEWDKTVHDLKKESSVEHLLKYLRTTGPGRNFVFRQVATKSDFEYYLEHLMRASYDAYNIVYLCFHGSNGEIHFANNESITLHQLAKDYSGIFKDKKVHFGSCSTLNISKDAQEEFKKLTEAKLVTGYSAKVDFHASFLFELWLLHLMTSHGSLGPARLAQRVEKEMKYYADKLHFRFF